MRARKDLSTLKFGERFFLTKKSKTPYRYIGLLPKDEPGDTNCHYRAAKENWTGGREWDTTRTVWVDTGQVSEPITDEEVVFKHWVDTCRSSGRAPIFDDKRRRAVQNALKSHGLDKSLKAIDGILESAWHQGANGKGIVYDDLTLILRDAEHIERFAALAEEAGDW